MLMRLHIVNLIYRAFLDDEFCHSQQQVHARGHCLRIRRQSADALTLLAEGLYGSPHILPASIIGSASTPQSHVIVARSRSLAPTKSAGGSDPRQRVTSASRDPYPPYLSQADSILAENGTELPSGTHDSRFGTQPIVSATHKCAPASLNSGGIS
ncbi:hypothetical protein EV401DRAFT_1116398 [Pisolithus croceorrhizus]|nr:hypothetical protein EV401DRAFT_1116398 [Pisolithus croceorrhizus]